MCLAHNWRLTMDAHSPIRIVHPSEFLAGTAQTSGSVRLAAIAPESALNTALWGGLFEVKPRAHTGIHHHGEQQTIAYVLEGVCEVRWGAHGEYVAETPAGDFIHHPENLQYTVNNPAANQT